MWQFQSTRPIRGATRRCRGTAGPAPHFNPRAPYGARPVVKLYSSSGLRISIHAPHTGRDPTTLSTNCGRRHFNPRAPYGARPRFRHVSTVHRDISIHAPHTGRDGFQHVGVATQIGISIHAPHTGRDLVPQELVGQQGISIHAPHTGRDQQRVSLALGHYHFNPRAPYGARLCTFNFFSSAWRFQSTRPIRGATHRGCFTVPFYRYFNPRAPYGARPELLGFPTCIMDFNPRAPYGARRHRQTGRRPLGGISIHAPHTGRDLAASSSTPETA